MSLPAPTRHCVQCACRLAEKSANVVLARSKADPSRCEDCADHPVADRFDEHGDRLVAPGVGAPIRIAPGGPQVVIRDEGARIASGLVPDTTSSTKPSAG